MSIAISSDLKPCPQANPSFFSVTCCRYWNTGSGLGTELIYFKVAKDWHWLKLVAIPRLSASLPIVPSTYITCWIMFCTCPLGYISIMLNVFMYVHVHVHVLQVQCMHLCLWSDGVRQVVHHDGRDDQGRRATGNHTSCAWDDLLRPDLTLYYICVTYASYHRMSRLWAFSYIKCS